MVIKEILNFQFSHNTDCTDYDILTQQNMTLVQKSYPYDWDELTHIMGMEGNGYKSYEDRLSLGNICRNLRLYLYRR